MREEASAIIQREMQEKTGMLNLSRMDLSEVPQELSKMVWLQELNLRDNQIKEINGLESLTNLQRLNLNNNQIKEIKGLETLTKLKELSLNSNQINEITGIERLYDLTDLSLVINSISEIKGLDQLLNLQNLDLTSNRIRRIEGLGSLTSLVNLRLNNNQINKTTGLEALSNLKVLSLNSNKISDLRGLEKIKNLISLSLARNQIIELKGLEALKRLQALDLRDNQINEIKGLEALTSLQGLSLGNNQIKDLNGLGTLTSLQQLFLDSNLISRLTGIEKLKKLQELTLSRNQISELKGLEELKELQKLSLNENQINRIKELEALNSLQELDIRWNHIKDVSERLVLLNQLKEIKLENNPIETPPLEVCQGGIDGIRSWYQSAGKIHQDPEGHWRLIEDQGDAVAMVPLHEMKMVLIGNGNVGKTSLALRLRDRNAPLPTPKERTPGLQVYKWEKNIRMPEVEESQFFRFNIWDFGGQGKFRAVQQLFCSRKSLYLYVTSPDDNTINSQEDYRDFGYWLAMVRAYSFDQEASQASPVIHVSNKQDIGAVPVNEEAMRDIYPDLHPVTVRTSAHTNKGLDDLEEVIEDVLPKVSYDVFTSTYSPRWLELKEALEKRPEAYLPLVEYEQMARTHGLSDLETGQWLRVLHRLGTVIYFESVPELRNTVFLKPEWVREAAYSILLSQAIEENYGKFRKRDFPLIWPNHTEEEHQKLIALMRTFELCYVTKDDYGHPLYFAPALFPAQAPDAYNFTGLSLPHHPVLVLRFLFQPFLPAGLLHRLIVRLHTWLHRSYSWRKGAVLHHHETYAEITEDWENKQLLVKLKGQAPQELFGSLRKEVEQIIADLKNNKMLIQLEVNYEGFFEEEWLKLAHLERLTVDFWQQKASFTGVKLFISYAREDESYKSELVKHLSGLRQNGAIKDWNDRQILPGQDWDQEIKEKLEESQVVLFLISADFMHSDYIHDVEIARTIRRHRENLVTIIPIVIRPCDFSSLEISKRHALPVAPGEGLKPVSEWSNGTQPPWKSDSAWLNVVNGLKGVISALAPGQREVK